MQAISSTKITKWKKHLLKPFYWNKEMIGVTVELIFILLALIVLKFFSQII